MIIVWTEHTSVVVGSVAKYVCCEKCSTEYGYMLTRRGEGWATATWGIFAKAAAQRAKRTAEDNLRYALEHGIDPRPCPKCYHLQSDMVKEATRDHLFRMSFQAVPLYLIFAVVPFAISYFVWSVMLSSASLPPEVFYGAWLVVLIGIMILPFIRLVLIRSFDPNALTLQQKMMKGWRTGVREDDWKAMMEAEMNVLGLTEVQPKDPFPRPQTAHKRR